MTIDLGAVFPAVGLLVLLDLVERVLDGLPVAPLSRLAVARQDLLGPELAPVDDHRDRVEVLRVHRRPAEVAGRDEARVADHDELEGEQRDGGERAGHGLLVEPSVSLRGVRFSHTALTVQPTATWTRSDADATHWKLTGSPAGLGIETEDGSGERDERRRDDAREGPQRWLRRHAPGGGTARTGTGRRWGR